MKPYPNNYFHELRRLLLINFYKVETDKYFNTKLNQFRKKISPPNKSETVNTPLGGSCYTAYNTFRTQDGIQYCFSQASGWLLLHIKGHVIITEPRKVQFTARPCRTPETYIHAALAAYPTLLKLVPTWKYRNLVRLREYAISNENLPSDEDIKNFDRPLEDSELELYEANFRLSGY
jgi:hypothetical protein